MTVSLLPIMMRILPRNLVSTLNASDARQLSCLRMASENRESNGMLYTSRSYTAGQKSISAFG